AAEHLEGTEPALGEEGHLAGGAELLAAGDERVGDLADGIGGQVVVAHEGLDGQHRALLVAEEARYLLLEIEGEPVLLASAQVVELVADAQKEIASGLEARHLRAGEDGLLQQAREATRAEADASDPQGRLQVAQAAIALLEVGLEEEDGVAE